MSLIDLHGFVANLKDHVSEHGFHVHGDRHFVETYSNRQTWEVDLHPDHACGGPLDMVLCVEAEPRTLLTFEDDVNSHPVHRGHLQRQLGARVAAVTDAAERSVNIEGRVELALSRIYLGQDLEVLCDMLDRARSVCEFLLDRAPAWLGEL